MTDKYHSSTVNGELRTLCAIQVDFETGDDGAYHGIICWPATPDTEKTCAKIIDSIKTWLTIRAGSAVNVRNEEGEWITRRISLIKLWSVHPTKYNDLVVPSAQEWLDGTCVISGPLKEFRFPG